MISFREKALKPPPKMRFFFPSNGRIVPDAFGSWLGYDKNSDILKEFLQGKYKNVSRH